MRQKTINLRNQGSFDKKIDFFSQTLSHIPRWVCLEQKTQAKNSHAWAPLMLYLFNETISLRFFFDHFPILNQGIYIMAKTWPRNTDFKQMEFLGNILLYSINILNAHGALSTHILNVQYSN